MRNTNEASDQQPEQGLGLVDYYNGLTELILDHSAGTQTFHLGFCGPDATAKAEPTKLFDYLLRSNRMLMQGCKLTPEHRVLDSGCGLGGTAVWLARTHGVRVVGVTICEPHLEVAAKHAEQQGVGHLVEFHHGDFMQLPYADASFDVVLNQESACYAPDKLAYLRGVHRVLKPGGRWQSMDAYLDRSVAHKDFEEIHTAAYRGYYTAPWVDRRDMLATLEEAGFEQIESQDFTSEVLPITTQRRNEMIIRELMFAPRGQSKAHEDHDVANFNLDLGLKEGIFTYNFISGVKPAAP